VSTGAGPAPQRGSRSAGHRLSLSAAIGGQLTAGTRPGAGTTFTTVLPAKR
jgi:hypothetical protein